MSQSAGLLEELKRSMRANSVRYADVAEHLDMSESSVKRMFSRGDMSLLRLEQICALLDLSFLELTRASHRPATSKPRELTDEQELALADTPAALNFFYKLLQEWPVGKIEAEFNIDQKQSSKLLAFLERLKLIDREAGDRIRLLVDNRVAWRKHGPLWKRYRLEIQRQFFNAKFNEEGAKIGFEVAELSLEARGLLLQKLERLKQEFESLAELSKQTPDKERQSTGLLFATRAWQFRQVEGLNPGEELQKL